MRYPIPLLALLGQSVLLAACGSATGDLPLDPAAERPGGVFLDGESPVAPVDPLSVQPFSSPYPPADTLVARLGHVRLRALVEPLLEGRFVDAYLAVDDGVLALIGSGVEEGRDATETLACPGGGALRVVRERRASELVSSVAFSGCRIDGTTLSGELDRAVPLDTGASEGAAGADETLGLRYRELVVDDGAGGIVEMLGGTRRSVARRTSDECGGVAVETTLRHAIERASVTADGSTERVSDLRHELVRESAREVPADNPALCRERITLDFAGRATVSGGRFETRGLILAREGRIVRDDLADAEPPAEATLSIDVDDGSRLALRLLSDRGGTAEVDAFADGAAVSFVTRYRFEE